MSAAFQAGVNWVQRNSTLLQGFSLRLTIVDSKCDPNHALSDFGSRLRRGETPDLIVGAGGCSSVAVPLQKMTAAMGIPMVGSVANSGSLSSKPLFVRFSYSYDAMGQLAGAIAHSIKLTSVGAVYEPVFSTISTNLANTQLGISACGSLALSKPVLQDTEGLPHRLDKLHAAGCRCPRQCDACYCLTRALC